MMATTNSDKKFKLNSLEEAIFGFPQLLQPEDLLTQIEKFVRRRGNLLRRDTLGCNYFHVLGDSLLCFKELPSEEQMSVIYRVFDIFINAGLPLDSPNRVGNTPLLNAIMHRNIPMTVALLEKGAEIDSRNHGGMGVWEILTQPSPFPSEMVNTQETEKILRNHAKKNAEIFACHLKGLSGLPSEDDHKADKV